MGLIAKIKAAFAASAPVYAGGDASRADNVAVRLLAHTARMVWVMQDNPKHVRGPEYDAQMMKNRPVWASFSGTGKANAVAAAEMIHDLTPERVQAAVAALEN